MLLLSVYRYFLEIKSLLMKNSNARYLALLQFYSAPVFSDFIEVSLAAPSRGRAIVLLWDNQHGFY